MSKLASLSRIITLAILMSASLVCVAQPDVEVPGDPQNSEPDQVPITGIEILIGLGGLLGAKKYYDLRKKNTEE